MKRLAVTSSATLALAVVLAVGSSPATAAVDPIPQDVQAAFSEQALASLRSTNETTVDVGNMGDAGVPDFSEAAQFGQPHLIYTWSAAMIAGDTKANPIESIDEWTAPFMTAGGVQLGTYRVWRPAEKVDAEMAGYNNDVELAESLAAMPSDAYLVHDPPTEAWFSVRGGIVSPLGHLATMEVPDPTSVESLTPIIAKRYADAMAASAGGTGAVGTNLWLLAGGIAVVIAGAATAAAVVIRRRRATS